MSNIYTGQRIPLRIPFTDKDGVVPLTGGSVEFDYWNPTNKTKIPDGRVVGSIEGDPTLGIGIGSIPAGDNTIAGDTMRIQGVAILSGDEWPACTELNIKILERGTNCN